MSTTSPRLFLVYRPEAAFRWWIKNKEGDVIQCFYTHWFAKRAAKHILRAYANQGEVRLEVKL